MRIGMISADMQDFGGLEEYAVSLAVALKSQGNDVSFLSMKWVSPENQYYHRLISNGVSLLQPPGWISRPASDWKTKERILYRLMICLSPLNLLLALTLLIFKHRPFKQAWMSSYNWLNGRLMDRFLGHDFRRQIGGLLLNWWRLRWRPDILHIQGYTTALLFVIEWADEHGIPVVYEEHQTPDPQFNWWMGFESSINKADRVIAVSERSAQGLRDVCRVTRPVIVRNPLLSDPCNSGWRKDLGPTDHAHLNVTTIARLYVTKGLTYLLEVAALVGKTHPMIEFRVYGEGELREELVERANRMGLDGKNIFAGAFTSRAELNRIMANTDIFLLTSILEGQPLVIVEAMAYGRAIVSTAVGGIPELVTDGQNGFLCPPANPGCLAEKVKILIENSNLREQFGNAARAAYERSPFQAEAVSSHFSAVYTDVLIERGKLRTSKPAPA